MINFYLTIYLTSNVSNVTCDLDDLVIWYIQCDQMANLFFVHPGLFFVYFRPFLIPITNKLSFNLNWKKHKWCAWDLNTGLQDGRRRQNHGAMAAALWLICLEANYSKQNCSLAITLSRVGSKYTLKILNILPRRRNFAKSGPEAIKIFSA